jgi:hypothetical protein
MVGLNRHRAVPMPGSTRRRNGVILAAIREGPGRGSAMRRIALSLLVLLACADVTAREVRLSGPDGNGGTSDVVTAPKAATRKPAVAPRDAAPVRDTPVRPSVHGDAGNAPRTRWHSFLPGMFR